MTVFIYYEIFVQNSFSTFFYMYKKQTDKMKVGPERSAFTMFIKVGTIKISCVLHISRFNSS